MGPIRIVLADDHRIILEGLEQLFQRESDFEVLAACTNGEDALRSVRELKPDILVLDVDMPRMDGISVLRQIHDEQIPTRVVLLTATVGDADVLEAMRLGAWGLVLKEAASIRLVQSVRLVQRGQRALDQALVSRALEKVVRREDGKDRLLSPRETDVVRMVAAGLRNKEIAMKLSISEGTVKSYLHAIYEKLDVHGRVELTLYAQENGLL
jgi:DNA-binding NarL/FixJ family response regulator